jgi:hypothetical protein
MTLGQDMQAKPSLSQGDAVQCKVYPVDTSAAMANAVYIYDGGVGLHYYPNPVVAWPVFWGSPNQIDCSGFTRGVDLGIATINLVINPGFEVGSCSGLPAAIHLWVQTGVCQPSHHILLHGP